MKFQTLLLVAVSIASGNALAKMSECDTRCEETYKYCISSGKGSSKACLAALEKCRKACLKKNKSALPS